MTVQCILDTLQQQSDIYDQLLVIEKEKTETLIHNQIDQLNAIVQKERKLTRQAEELEQRRIQETASYMKSVGFQGPMTQIDQLIRAVSDPNFKQSFLKIKQKLSESLHQLKRINEMNQQLARQAIDFTEFSIGLMIEDPNEGFVYQHPINQNNGRGRNGLFDSRI
ncbi:flagellar protein FlgN [Cohnella zeiphila]|uniref:Flagellar protein FlgN n=1 Tax=Cohnella zeiphila TaxID=2761120 RepID=A0A7X0VVU3_9BACL|nr:flagellar protein FlgN [Cohnella zeiphila]MBB6732261.1 flagellar protein FlgN [Cohnella zeiphila]